MHPVIRFSLGLAASLGAIATATVLTAQPSRSQSLPACLPPEADEYLLIVLNPTDQVQTQLRNALPGNATATVCTYLADTVLRIDGFNSLDAANSWAQYVTDSSGLRAFVARPASEAASSTTPPAAIAPAPPTVPPTIPPTVAPPIATNPPQSPIAPPSATPSSTPDFPQPTSLAAPSPTPAPAPTPNPTPAVTPTPAIEATAPTTPPTRYNPQPLGAGFAVLVDYGNQPEVAIALRQVLTRDVGLVAYGQRPYLLAAQTTDLAAANAVLQNLSDRNFTALIVDSQSVILLTPIVAKLDSP